jgi:serine/threonine protein kinase
MLMQEREEGVADSAVGKYRIISLLGQGGTAEVYLAAADGPSGFCKLVVLKTLKAHLASDEEFRDMFLREARLAALLHHPNIVQTNEVLEPASTSDAVNGFRASREFGAPVIVMEYLDGQPLSQLIARGRTGAVTPAMQVRVLADALVGLHAAHELTDFDGAPLGLVHRDVSPQNIFVTVAGESKVLDFGIAKLERSLVETDAGTIKGKLRYMAPEQLAGQKLDRRTDIYAAGVILWEALAGERMWRGCEEAEIRVRVQNGALPLPRASRPEPSAAVRQICRRALALAPDDRYPTALAMADALEAALPTLAHVSRRTIGATVARLFDEERIATRAAIEEKLGRQSMTSFPVVTRTQEISVPLASGDLQTLLSATPTPSPASLSSSYSGLEKAPFVQAGFVRAVLAGVLLGLAVAALAVWGMGRYGHSRPMNGSDGAPGGLSPGAAVDPAASARSLPTTPEVAPASLRALRTSRSSRVGIRHATPPAGASFAPAAPSPRDCEHPFFVDTDGIKRIRPECR